MPRRSLAVASDRATSTRGLPRLACLLHSLPILGRPGTMTGTTTTRRGPRASGAPRLPTPSPRQTLARTHAVPIRLSTRLVDARPQTAAAWRTVAVAPDTSRRVRQARRATMAVCTTRPAFMAIAACLHSSRFATCTCSAHLSRLQLSGGSLLLRRTSTAMRRSTAAHRQGGTTWRRCHLALRCRQPTSQVCQMATPASPCLCLAARLTRLPELAAKARGYRQGSVQSDHEAASTRAHPHRLRSRSLCPPRRAQARSSRQSSAVDLRRPIQDCTDNCSSTASRACGPARPKGSRALASSCARHCATMPPVTSKRFSCHRRRRPA